MQKFEASNIFTYSKKVTKSKILIEFVVIFSKEIVLITVQKFISTF